MNWQQEFFPAIIAFIFGACVGSFLNVCIYRIPRGISIVLPRSYCTNCGAFIPWYKNIPLVSWWMILGRASCCGVRISMRYWWIELITAAMYAAFVGYFGPLVGTVYAVFFSFLLVAFFTDLDFMIIPDEVNYAAAAYAFLCSTALAAYLNGGGRLLEGATQSVLGGVTGAGSLWLIAKLGTLLLKKEAMGLGDVKLMLAIGAMLGWEGALFSIGAGAIIGSIIGFVALISRGERFGSGVAIPFGPALIISAGIWVVVGREWWMRYFQQVQPFLN